MEAVAGSNVERHFVVGHEAFPRRRTAGSREQDARATNVGGGRFEAHRDPHEPNPQKITVEGAGTGAAKRPVSHLR